MSDTHTDLVIRISTSGSASDPTDASAEKTDDTQLITELRPCLQPGVEIVLVFEGYMARTSILWLSELQKDGSLHAGVRLLGVSALPPEPQESTASWEEVPRRAGSVHSHSAIIRQQL
jgi:hypothetical protein